MDFTKIISASVVPVVIISACGLLSLALYNRLAAVVSRLRSFQRERLREQQNSASGPTPTGGPRRELMLEMLAAQNTDVTRRAKLIRNALMLLLLTIATLICCSLMLGLSIIFPFAAFIAIALFLFGMVLMLMSMILAMQELSAALKPAELESRFVDEIVQFQNPDENQGG
jgi:hypothetical protein